MTTQKVRLLRDQPLGKCDEVIELPKDEAKELCDSGAADASPAAVKFAESLASKKDPA